MDRLINGFRHFVMRGNVIDLAVGIVIGAAFTSVVTAFTKSFIEPLLKVFGGGGELGGSFTVRGAVFDWAGFINSVVTFLLTAAVLYLFVVTPMNRFADRRRRGEAPPPKAPSEEIILLTEIRDALTANKAAVKTPPSKTADDEVPQQRSRAE
jgi:large conductance mechanosensitive channel